MADRPPRAPVPRGLNGRAKVSGRPPWEPAAKPDGELPWVAAPAPPTATPLGAAPHRPRPAGSLWDTAAASARAAALGPAQPTAAAAAGRAEDAGARSPEDAGPAGESMYVWGQTETTTEAFPAISEDEGS